MVFQKNPPKRLYLKLSKLSMFILLALGLIQFEIGSFWFIGALELHEEWPRNDEMNKNVHE
jgi:hypothetical protein